MFDVARLTANIPTGGHTHSICVAESKSSSIERQQPFNHTGEPCTDDDDEGVE